MLIDQNNYVQRKLIVKISKFFAALFIFNSLHNCFINPFFMQNKLNQNTQYEGILITFKFAEMKNVIYTLKDIYIELKI